MTRIIVATHERLAEGFGRTLEYIAPGVTELITVSAYVENIPVEEEIQSLLGQIDANEQVIILTDLLGGSVNQTCSRYLQQGNIHLIAGVNFPLLLSLALEASAGNFSVDDLRNHIEEAKNQLVYVNDYLHNQSIDMDDE